MRALALAAALLGSAPAASAIAPGGIVGHEQPELLPATEVNKRVTDPVSTTWSIKLKNELQLLDVAGHGTEAEYRLRLQPAMPMILDRRFKLIARPEFTLLDDKPYAAAGGALRRSAGFGDTILDLVLAPRAAPWLLALGPTFVFPTASAEPLGQGKWQIGPAGVFGYRARTWLAGVILQQWFSYAGDADRQSVSELHLQYLASWFFGDGWSIGTSPTMQVDWNAASGQRVTFPLGPSFGRVARLGGTLPVKLELDLFYVPVHPDGGQQAVFQLKVTPVVPSPF